MVSCWIAVMNTLQTDHRTPLHSEFPGMGVTPQPPPACEGDGGSELQVQWEREFGLVHSAVSGELPGGAVLLSSGWFAPVRKACNCPAGL